MDYAPPLLFVSVEPTKKNKQLKTPKNNKHSLSVLVEETSNTNKKQKFSGVSLHQRCAAYSSGVPLTSNGSQPKQIEANHWKSKKIETIRSSGVPLTPAVCRLHQRWAA